MGQLYAFELTEIINKYNLKNYVETGTGEGISLEYALKYPFEKFYSVDIDGELIEKAKKKFSNYSDKLELFHEYSTDALLELSQKIKDTPTLFFLDAHFPGADFQRMSYEESIRTFKEMAYPLKQELDIIKNNKNYKQDVIIIDDLMLYEPNADYDSIKEGVVWKYKWLENELNLDINSQFIYDIFSSTHDFTKDLRHQGYLILTPK